MTFEGRALLGLTLHRPWTTLIARGIKKIENRSWSPGLRLRAGEWFAIHAGMKWDENAVSMALRLGLPLETFASQTYGGAIVAVARYDGVVTESSDPWFFGPFGWLLGDVIDVGAVPCRGMQGLWAVPDATAAPLRQRIADRAATGGER